MCWRVRDAIYLADDELVHEFEQLISHLASGQLMRVMIVDCIEDLTEGNVEVCIGSRSG